MFFPVQWMAYRKMYIGALLYVAISILAIYVISLFLMSIGVWINGRLIVDAFRVVMGFLANIFYVKKAWKVIEKAKTKKASDRKMYLKNKGGVDGAALALSIAIEVGLAILIFGVL